LAISREFNSLKSKSPCGPGWASEETEHNE
jgi:hypothetical protein